MKEIILKRNGKLLECESFNVKFEHVQTIAKIKEGLEITLTTGHIYELRINNETDKVEVWCAMMVNGEKYFFQIDSMYNKTGE